MDGPYFLRRMRAAQDMASKAEDSLVRLIHLDFAGRYSVAATAGRATTR